MQFRSAFQWIGRLFREAWRVARLHQSLFLSGTFLAAAFSFALMRLDRPFLNWLVSSRPAWAVTLAQALSQWGELQMIPAAILLVIWALGRWKNQLDWQKAAGAGLFAGVVAGLVANIIKMIVGRPRPSAGLADGFYSLGWHYNLQSFPSGHATHCAAISAAIFVLMPRTGLACALATLAVSWSRMYLERHYLSDVVMGLWVGSAIGIIFGLAVTKKLAANTVRSKVSTR